MLTFAIELDLLIYLFFTYTFGMLSRQELCRSCIWDEVRKSSRHEDKDDLWLFRVLCHLHTFMKDLPFWQEAGKIVSAWNLNSTTESPTDHTNQNLREISVQSKINGLHICIGLCQKTSVPTNALNYHIVNGSPGFLFTGITGFQHRHLCSKTTLKDSLCQTIMPWKGNHQYHYVLLTLREFRLHCNDAICKSDFPNWLTWFCVLQYRKQRFHFRYLICRDDCGYTPLMHLANRGLFKLVSKVQPKSSHE